MLADLEAPVTGPEDVPSQTPVENISNPPDIYEEPPPITDNDGTDPQELNFGD